MNALIIWVVVPLIAAASLYFIRRWERVIYITGTCMVYFLAWLAWRLPTGESSASIRLWAGFPSIKIAESFNLLGQRFVLSNNSYPVIMLIYLGVGFWLGGAYLAHVDRLFVPLGIAISALQVSAFAIESSWRAPLILELIALVVVPLLSPPGKPVKRGALRFITFQTVGACLLLFSERWWLASLTDTAEIDRALVPLLVMGIGYAFILGVIPFHTWVSMSAEEIDPYKLAFILYALPVGVSFLLLKDLDHFILLGASNQIYSGLRWLGIWLFVAASIWAVFERHLGRMLGFFALTQVGLLLLTTSMSSGMARNPSIVGILFSQLMLMSIGLAVWALALHSLQLHDLDLRLDPGQGLAYSLPITTGCLLIAQLSLCGLPLFAGFHIYSAFWTMPEQLSSRNVLLLMVGILFLFFAGLRTLRSFTANRPLESRQYAEIKIHSLLLIMGCTILLVLGLAPQWFVPSLVKLGEIFVGANP